PIQAELQIPKDIKAELQTPPSQTLLLNPVEALKLRVENRSMMQIPKLRTLVNISCSLDIRLQTVIYFLNYIFSIPFLYSNLLLRQSIQGIHQGVDFGIEAV
ncbi:hypothetical protein, partial [Algoriphagus sp.]|uniref:hypothetical protein n=1 Tax=Algoriphagus sp. TaxID=1872435 RepID=UPI003297C534